MGDCYFSISALLKYNYNTLLSRRNLRSHLSKWVIENLMKRKTVLNNSLHGSTRGVNEIKCKGTDSHCREQVKN